MALRWMFCAAVVVGSSPSLHGSDRSSIPATVATASRRHSRSSSARVPRRSSRGDGRTVWVTVSRRHEDRHSHGGKTVREGRW